MALLHPLHSATRLQCRGAAPCAPTHCQCLHPPAGVPGLEGEHEQPDDEAGAGLGALNSITFRQANAAAVQQERDESHAAAIFGGSGPSGPGGSNGAQRPAARPAGGQRSRAAAAGQRAGGAAGPAGSAENLLALAVAEGAVVVPAAELGAVLNPAEQPAAAAGAGPGGGALSWRERALAAKRAKQQGQ